jgi:myo-inositol 2-dehydrogenase/D-chiro-inositol 1-dehydrogenase
LRNTKLRLGIIGAGRIGRVHAENITLRIPSAVIAAIFDSNNKVAAAVAEEYGIARTATRSSDILNDPDIDAVLICSPTPTHAELIIDAARGGKHVFCEKPLDSDLGRIDDILAAVKGAGTKLQVGFNRRFDANFARARQALMNGEVGTPYILHIISRDPAPPPIAYIRSSGGIFLDMTIHDFDMARFLMADEVEEIYALGAVRVDPEIGAAGDMDTAVISVRFRNGAIGTIDNCRQAVYGYDQRVEILGSAGAIATNNVYRNEAIISTAAEIKRDPPLTFFMERYTESYVNEIRAFVDATMNDKPVPVSGIDGKISVLMVKAAEKSYAENRPVKLTEIAS